jgi:hypothetical protein
LKEKWELNQCERLTYKTISSLSIICLKHVNGISLFQKRKERQMSEGKSDMKCLQKLTFASREKHLKRRRREISVEWWDKQRTVNSITAFELSA